MTLLGLKAVKYSDRVLLHYLKSKANHLGEVRVSCKTITHEAGMSRNTVYEAMSRLDEAGLISRKREPGDCYTCRVIDDNCA